jgi:hypothetical protein
VIIFRLRTGHCRLQIPAHCNIQGNEEAGQLAKEGTNRYYTSLSHNEAKITVKAVLRTKWRNSHLRYDQNHMYQSPGESK